MTYNYGWKVLVIGIRELPMVKPYEYHWTN